MDTLIHLIGTYGLWVVFIAVLIDQGGIPLPAWPALIVISAMTVDAGGSLWPIVLVAALAALLADAVWYLGGRRFGGRLIRLLCRLSLSPDSCVGTTRGIYARWGAPALVVAKFVPGFAAIATSLAGQMRTGVLRFAFFDGLGALLWAIAAVALGAIFHAAVNDVLAQLELLGQLSLIVLLAVVVLFVAWKAWKRQRFLHSIRMARISVAELRQALGDGGGPLVLDVRPDSLRAASGWIPGAIRASRVEDLALAPQQEAVVYCDCPNEASAALLARALHQRGFARVRPLAGGFAAWQAAGAPVEGGDPPDREVAR